MSALQPGRRGAEDLVNCKAFMGLAAHSLCAVGLEDLEAVHKAAMFLLTS